MVNGARTLLNQRFETLLFFCFLLQNRGGHPQGAVIPPHWANETLNPCAKESWQLVHWPEDGNCYHIFTQGPCRETRELYFDEDKGRASCRCSRGTSWHPESRMCHVTFSKGPCGRGEYFALKEPPEDDDDDSTTSQGECLKYNECSPGHLFWPPLGKCFLHLSRGPCLDGNLLYVHPETGSTECGCQPELMSTNYWNHGNSCHELFTKGPCVEGHLFIYNLTNAVTECVCGPRLLSNYHHQTGRCYELDTTGPCRQGQVFLYDSTMNEARCSCLPGFVEWLPTGTCYRSFTRGPCLPGEFLRPHTHKELVGTCDKSSCLPGELFDPSSAKCYPVGRRGPCSRGKLWVFERATSVRGSCHCDPHLIGYWALHGICYELGEQGPCPKRKVLSYEKKKGLLRCRCDFRRGFIPWANGRCIKAGVRRNKLVPVAGPLGPSIGGNIIQVERVHRGLTLPLQEERVPNISTPIHRKISPMAQTMQEEILKDVLTTILKNATSDNVKETPKENAPPIQIETQTQTETETIIHTITMSRSVTRKKKQWNEAPTGRRALLRTRRVTKREKEREREDMDRIKTKRRDEGGRRTARSFPKLKYTREPTFIF